MTEMKQMKPKVKIIETIGSARSLESQINQFLQKIDVDNFIDIRLSSLEGIDSSLTNDKHVALIMYLE
jgi:Sporulation protein Cse60